MSPNAFIEDLRDALREIDGADRIRTFADAGLLTRNEGLVVRLDDGSEFQITVVRSCRGDNDD